MAGTWVLVALCGACVFAVKGDMYPALAVVGVLAWLVACTILIVRAVRIGAYAFPDYLKIRGQLVTRSIAWELVDAVETRVVKDLRSTYYLPAIEYRDAGGRSRVAVMYWTASMRPRSAARNEAMIKALVPEGRLPSWRRLRSDDIISPG